MPRSPRMPNRPANRRRDRARRGQVIAVQPFGGPRDAAGLARNDGTVWSRHGGTHRLAALKANAGRLIAVVLVVGVFAFVLPRVADYGEVWDAISGLSTLGVAALIAVGDPQPR